jgi:1-aminocyclopropane-1-carboxylate deaminase/D-cysteine desulfhydrase-like pyridoxal-dependent ACC family enzyme
LHTLSGFNEQYRGLFGLADENDEAEQKETKNAESVFTENFGWIYSAKQVAEMEGIPLDAVYDLSVIQFLNDLAYLKQKRLVDEYQYQQSAKRSFS